MNVVEIKRAYAHCKIDAKIFINATKKDLEANGYIMACPRSHKKECNVYYPSVISNMIQYADVFIYINRIIVDGGSRHNGFGTQALQCILKEFKGIPVILSAGFVDEEDYNMAIQDKTLFDSMLALLVKFYEKSDFINANILLGNDQEQIAMVHPNRNIAFIAKMMDSYHKL